MLRLCCFTSIPLCHHCLTHPSTVDQLEPLDMLFYPLCQRFYYVSTHPLGSILSATSHGQRPYLAHQTLPLPEQSTFLRDGNFAIPAPTGLDTSVYYTPSAGYPTIGFETYATACCQKSVLQHLGPSGGRQPLYGNIWQPLPNLQGDLPGLRPQSLCFRLENCGDGHYVATMVDTFTGLRLLHDDRYGSGSPDAWRPSPFFIGHLELVLPLLEDSPTPWRLHPSWVHTSGGDTPPRSTGHRLCCTHSSDSSRASIRHGNALYKDCHLNFKTSNWQVSHKKGKKTRSLKFSGLSAVLHSYLLSLCWNPGFVCHLESIPLMSCNIFLWTSLGQFSASVCFWPHIHCFFSWRTSRLMTYTGCSLHLLRSPWTILLAHIYHLMIQPRHHIFLGRPGWSQLRQTVHTIFIKKLSYPFTSRPDELWIVERTADGRETWKPVETFLENMHLTRDRATLRTTANNWRQYYDIPTSSPSSSTATPSPVLPHPEHSNVSVSQPFDAIPDQLHILQSCWGRSALHHSQGTTISLSWPPWRSTPPSPPSTTLHRTLQSNHPTTTGHRPHRPVPHEEPSPMDMSDSSVWSSTLRYARKEDRLHGNWLAIQRDANSHFTIFSFCFTALWQYMLICSLGSTF